MRTKVKKLFKGCIDLRDYNVTECIRKHENYIVIYMDETMTLTPQDLTNKCLHIQPMESIRETKSYELFSYKWISDKLKIN